MRPRRICVPRMKCLARLTNWDKTGEAIGDSKMRASIVKLCANTPSNGLLCQECLSRPRDGKYQSRMLHGLLTEPIPAASHIYGGAWYWERVAKHGDPPTAWIEMAEEAQKAGEDRCAGLTGQNPVMVQRPNEKEMQRIGMAKKVKDSKAAVNRLRKSASAPILTDDSASASSSSSASSIGCTIKGTLLTTFAPITTMYVESAKPVTMMPTDSYTMRKEVWDDTEVWITQNGLVFDTDVRGEADVCIGRYADGIFTPH